MLQDECEVSEEGWYSYIQMSGPHKVRVVIMLWDRQCKEEFAAAEEDKGINETIKSL